jgi:PTH1 family peptidyl-tRNA hydrolase
MKLIVGLGNPGLLYKNSRHNIGIQVVKGLAKEYNIKLARDKSVLCKQGHGIKDGIDFLLAHPLLFMNLSGESVNALVKKYKIKLEDLLVICDDLDLGLGKIRIRPRGSSAGHKGVKSIIEHLRSDSFPRLRIGIGRPAQKKDIKGFVLSKFKKEEVDLINEAIRRAIRCSQLWLRHGIKEVTNNPL